MSQSDGGGHHFDCSLALFCFSAAAGLFTGVGFTLVAGACLVTSLLCWAGSCWFSRTGGFCSNIALRARHVRSITLHPVFWLSGVYIRGWGHKCSLRKDSRFAFV